MTEKCLADWGFSMAKSHRLSTFEVTEFSPNPCVFVSQQPSTQSEDPPRELNSSNNPPLPSLRPSPSSRDRPTLPSTDHTYTISRTFKDLQREWAAGLGSAAARRPSRAARGWRRACARGPAGAPPRRARRAKKALYRPLRIYPQKRRTACVRHVLTLS